MSIAYSIAIDLGSNTLRVTKLACKEGVFVASYEKSVKTADRLGETGVISQEAMKRIVCAIEEAKEEIDFSNTTIKAVTTEAIRQAKNKEEVLAYIAKKTGVFFEIISGETEARLTLNAVVYRLEKLEIKRERFVLVDIGGGSTEIIFHYKEQRVSQSFPVGIVTIAQRYQTLSAIEEALPYEMQAMWRFCEEVYRERGETDALIATAGTPTTVASMKLGLDYAHYDAQKVNGVSLSFSELDFYLNVLLKMPFDVREKMVGTGRSDLITAGILIFKEIYRMTAFESSLVIDDGLREGIALEVCANTYIGLFE